MEKSGVRGNRHFQILGHCSNKTDSVSRSFQVLPLLFYPEPPWVDALHFVADSISGECLFSISPDGHSFERLINDMNDEACSHAVRHKAISMAVVKDKVTTIIIGSLAQIYTYPTSWSIPSQRKPKT